MSSTPETLPAGADTTGWFGHPRGLFILFFTEMWERFSYYGMRAFLILYMVAPVASGGLGLSDAHAASIYGTYTGSAWGAAILGGLAADRLLGQYTAVFLGGLVIALGHFTLAFKALWSFYAGLTLIVVGTGLLKPNVSILVGSLYPAGDPRRDSGFSLFYMGINSGALIGPLIAGYLAQRVDWHAGFAAAGVGMAIGLAQVPGWAAPALPPGFSASLTSTRSGGVNAPRPHAMRAGYPDLRRPSGSGSAPSSCSSCSRRCSGARTEQAGSTLNLFADRYTRLSVLGWSFPSSWFQSVQPVFVIILAPVFAWLWRWLGRREPSSPAKFAYGLLFVGLAFLLLVPAGRLAQEAGIKVSPWWLVWAYFIAEVGELCLSPVGLSVVTKLSPARVVGLMMGVFFLSNAVGNKLAGFAAGFFSTMPLASLFGTVAAVTMAASVVLFLMVPWVRRLMGGIH